MNLVKYLFSKWVVTMNEKLSDNQTLLMANVDGLVTVVRNSSVEILDWLCDHEEADTKMLVMVKYIVDYHNIQRVIISSPDTDVIVISLYQYCTVFNTNLNEFWFKTGTADKRRYIPIHERVSTLGDTICRILPAFHCITGCDTTSSFAGIGKGKSYKVMLSNIDAILNMSEFGDTPDMSLDNPAVESAIQFVCMLYESRSINIDINYLRYKLFTQKGYAGEKIPPTLDALVLHLRRANYQCYVWKNACNAELGLPSPVGNGWTLVDGVLQQEYILNPPVPDTIAELVRCKCSKGCSNNLCSCRKHDLPCTDACFCNEKEECQNTVKNQENSDDDDDDDDEDD